MCARPPIMMTPMMADVIIGRPAASARRRSERIRREQTGQSFIGPLDTFGHLSTNNSKWAPPAVHHARPPAAAQLIIARRPRRSNGRRLSSISAGRAAGRGATRRRRPAVSCGRRRGATAPPSQHGDSDEPQKSCRPRSSRLSGPLVLLLLLSLLRTVAIVLRWPVYRAHLSPSAGAHYD
jgi:hypothetical protein